MKTANEISSTPKVWEILLSPHPITGDNFKAIGSELHIGRDVVRLKVEIYRIVNGQTVPGYEPVVKYLEAWADSRGPFVNPLNGQKIDPVLDTDLDSLTFGQYLYPDNVTTRYQNITSLAVSQIILDNLVLTFMQAAATAGELYI